MNEVLVVGGGPAGAACALWLHQVNLPVLLLEAGPRLGGHQPGRWWTDHRMPGIEGQPGEDVARQLQAHLRTTSVPHAVNARVVSVRRTAGHLAWEVCTASCTHRGRCVVFATGSRPRSGGFVETARVGIGPAACMERDVQGMRVAVLGGGDGAFHQAALALRRGARGVGIFCRRAPHAQPLLRNAIPPECVNVGPFHANQVHMKVNAREFDVLAVQFGFEACVPPGLCIPLRRGYIDVDKTGAVRGFPGLFAAGEVTDVWHPCVTTSFAHGVQVAQSIYRRHRAAEQSHPAPQPATPRSHSIAAAACW